jgi:hypothetical protein
MLGEYANNMLTRSGLTAEKLTMSEFWFEFDWSHTVKEKVSSHCNEG